MRMLLVAGAVVMAGCASSTIGRKIDYDKVRALKVDESTKETAYLALGKPMFVFPGVAPTDELWIYQYTKARSAIVPLPFYTAVHTNMDQDQITLGFDKQGVLRDIRGFIPPTKPAKADDDGVATAN